MYVPEGGHHQHEVGQVGGVTETSVDITLRTAHVGWLRQQLEKSSELTVICISRLFVLSGERRDWEPV